MDEVILTTCPRDCYDACGVLVAKRDGQIRHVRGDPSHPVSRGRLCRQCATAYNGVLRDRDARLLGPLRRSGPKGSGRFEPLSWDEALAEIAARLGGLPGETMLNAHYTGTFALARLPLPAALLQPPRRDRGRPRHDLQQGRARRARLPVRQLAGRLRPAQRA